MSLETPDAQEEVEGLTSKPKALTQIHVLGENLEKAAGYEEEKHPERATHGHCSSNETICPPEIKQPGLKQTNFPNSNDTLLPTKTSPLEPPPSELPPKKRC